MGIRVDGIRTTYSRERVGDTEWSTGGFCAIPKSREKVWRGMCRRAVLGNALIQENGHAGTARRAGCREDKKKYEELTSCMAS